MEIIATCILAFGTMGTLIAAWLIYNTLKSDHDWKRREYAINIVKDWNMHTSGHWQAIENVFPHLRDVDRTGGKVTELTKQQAKDIYTCEPDSEPHWGLRYHLVELLNHLEFVSMAYTQRIADHEIITECLKDAMVKYHDILKNLIEVVETCEGYQPWVPYSILVRKWKSFEPTIRKPTA